MSNRELLKEAIADAKAVKEMAISNAKAALEEAFTPQLKSMLEKKLTEMDEEDEKKMVEVKMHDEKKMEEEEHVDETMTEEELNELLDELEEGEKKEHEMEEAEDHDKKMEEAEDEEMPEEEPEADEEKKEEEEIDLEDMTEEDLKAFIEDVVDEMIAAGELEAGDEEMEAPEEEIEVTDEESEEEPMMEVEEKEKMEELDLTAGGDFGALADMLGVSINAAKYLTVAFGLSVPAILAAIKIGGDKAIEGFKKIIGKKAEMEEAYHDEKEIKEALEVIETLKAELNEVNLLNSKLLYTNKIFKAKNLTEAQKVKVLTTFDKAETVKEVKLVYETLSEGLVSTSTPKEAIKESKSFASKAVGTSPKKPVVETDGMVNRFQKLAGIK